MDDEAPSVGGVRDEADETAGEALSALLRTDKEAARQYFEESFLTEAMLALFHARRAANRTQADVARRLGTTQSAIARWEADFSGGISLRNYIKFALACDARPFDLTFAKADDLRPFAAAHPEAPITVEAYYDWLAQLGLAAPPAGNAMPTPTTRATDSPTALTTQDATRAVREAERHVRGSLPQVAVQRGDGWPVARAS